MNCETCRNFMSDYFDAGSYDELKKTMENHLENCPECRRYFREYTAVIDGLESLDEPNVSEKTMISMWHHIDRETRSDKRIFRNGFVLVPLALALFIAGFLVRGRIDLPVAPGMQNVYTSFEYSACSNLYHYAYPINPQIVYVPEDDSIKSVFIPEFPNEINLPAMLSSHGPFSLYSNSTHTREGQMCIPFVSPYGQTLILRIIADDSPSQEMLFQVFKEKERVFYHRIIWHQNGYRYVLEGRVLPDYLFDLAEEIKTGLEIEA